MKISLALWCSLFFCRLSIIQSCPTNCQCTPGVSIFCTQRRSNSMPQGLPVSTKYMYLFQNGIETLWPEDFTGLVQLQMLDLSQNKLSELPDRVFEPLSALRNLDLSSNLITTINQGSFSGLVLLQRLYLHNNQINSIHPEAFYNMGHLLELKLQGNMLVSLPALHLPKLLLLDLSFNQILSPDPATFQVPNVECLKLAGLGLASLDEKLLGSLTNLRELDISSNQLRAVIPTLRGAQGVTHLNLSNNPIAHLKPEDLQGLSALKVLDISSLNLQSFPEGFHQLFPRLTHLTAAENPFNCVCSLAWLPGWLSDHKVIMGRSEETRCHFPPRNAAKELTKLKYSNFGCPVITTTASTTTTATPTNLPTTLTVTTSTISIPVPVDSTSVATDNSPSYPTPHDGQGVESLEKLYCPVMFCRNGGICQEHKRGVFTCVCLKGFTGSLCENEEKAQQETEGTTVIASFVKTDIISRYVTSTSIMLDLHQYIDARPYLRGIRLTYRNLSGHDRRPIHLILPVSYPEYTLRGLQPNSTYSICASPSSESISNNRRSCTEASTTSTSQLRLPHREPQDEHLPSMLTTSIAAAFLGLLVLVVVCTICYLRSKHSKSQKDVDTVNSPLELEGYKEGMDNGALLEKQPEMMPSVLQNGAECEIPLAQPHCHANNDMSSVKPSYF